MTAAYHKIILEQASDYRLQLRVKEDDGIHNRDLNGWGWVFEVYNAQGAKQENMCLATVQVAGQVTSSDCEYQSTGLAGVTLHTNDRVWDVSSSKAYKATAQGTAGYEVQGGDAITSLVADGVLAEDGNLEDGYCTIEIPAQSTKDFPTGISSGNLFATEFNYFYTLTLVEDGATKVTSHAPLSGVITTPGSYTSSTSREMRVMRGKLAVRI